MAGELLVVGFGPFPDAAECCSEAVAERRERVLHTRRDDGVNLAGEEAVGLHLAEGLGEHLLTDAIDDLGEAAEAKGAVLSEGLEDKHGPLVGDAADDLFDKTIDLRGGLLALGRLEVNFIFCAGR